MPTEVTIDTNQAETEVTITTNDASTNYSISAGARGPEGPNTVTTATLSNLTGFISANGTNVSGATAGSTAATASTLVLRDSSGNIAASNLSGTNTGDQFTSVASHHLLGRHAGSTGAAQEVNVGNGIEFQGSGIRRSALTGDVTASAGSNSTTIANDSVTNAKLANVATATIKGRTTAGTGDPEDLTLGTGIEFSGSTIRRSALTGDITASAGSNATTLAATIAGAKTLSGQLELTGQAATTANSAMTRVLADNRTVAVHLGTNFIVNNSATRADTTMVLSLGVGTWELNGFFETSNAATGGAKVYIAVDGATPESYSHRITMISVNGGSTNPNFSGGTPAFGGGTAPFVFSRAIGSGAGSNFQLLPSVIVLTASATFTIGFSQNTAAVGDCTLFAFSRFWANRITH